jgi:hypothetical protein
MAMSDPKPPMVLHKNILISKPVKNTVGNDKMDGPMANNSPTNIA